MPGIESPRPWKSGGRKVAPRSSNPRARALSPLLGMSAQARVQSRGLRAYTRIYTAHCAYSVLTPARLRARASSSRVLNNRRLGFTLFRAQLAVPYLFHRCRHVFRGFPSACASLPPGRLSPLERRYISTFPLGLLPSCPAPVSRFFYPNSFS